MTSEFTVAMLCDGYLKRAITAPLNLLVLHVELAWEAPVITVSFCFGRLGKRYRAVTCPT